MSSTEKDNLLPKADGGKSPTKVKYIRWFVLFLMLSVSAAFINSFYYQNLKESLLSLAFKSNQLCSGHGIVMDEDNCICDLGFEGQYCKSQSSTSLKEVMPSSVAIFTDAFGPLNSKDVLSLYYESLANNLKRSGHSVTVIYTGKVLSQFSTVSGMYESQGINIIMLKAEHDFVTVEQKSFATYTYLRSMSKDFSTVIFSSSSNTAYYTLNSVHQGLLLTKTKFLFSLDDLSEMDIELKEFPDNNHAVTDLLVLKKHFMMQESIKIAKQVISPSQSLVSFYKVKTSFKIMPHSPILETTSNIAFKDLKSIDELVFIGGRNNMDGLSLFCDAIDQVLLESKILYNTELTFFIFDRMINGISVKDFLEFRASKWETMKIKWNVKIDHDYQRIIQYFDDSEVTRVAIIPSLFSGAPIIQSELIGSRIATLSTGMNSSSDNLKMKDTIVNAILKKEFYPDALVDNQVESLKSFLQEKELADNIKHSIMETDLPLVSIILVHHNRPELLKQAIASLEKQTYTNFEVVLVDDGSTDAAAIAYVDELSWKWWEEKGWKVIREPNRYLGASRNTGVKHANGKYVLFMDDDDYAKPHQIETFVKVAMNTKAPVMTSGHDILNGLYSPSGRSSYRYVPIGGDILSGMLENVFGDSAMFIEKEYFIASGGFTEEYGIGFEDYEYLAKVALRGDVMEAIAEPLHWYRIHPGTMSESTQLKSNQLRVLRAYNSYNVNSDPNQKKLLLHVRDNFFKESDLDKREYMQFSSIFSNATSPQTTSMKLSISSTIRATAAKSASTTARSSSKLASISVTIRTSTRAALTTTAPLPSPTVTGPEPVLEFFDPSYIFDAPAANLSGARVNRKIVLVGKNFGPSSVLQIQAPNGGIFNLTNDPKFVALKNNSLNAGEKILVIDQSLIDTSIGSVGYEGGILQGIYFRVFNQFGKSKPVPLYYSSQSFFRTEQLQYTYNASGFHANIWLNRLLDTKTPYCILKRANDTGLGEQSTPAVYDRHSGQILCISNQTLSGPIYLVITASAPLAFDNSIPSNNYLAMISLNANPFMFQYQDVAPVMLSAVFADSGASVVVTFDKSIIIRGEDRGSSFFCRDVFVNNADQKSNSPILSTVKEDCLISRINSFTIQMTFDGRFLVNNPNKALKPFDTLYLNLNTVYNFNNPRPFSGRGSSGYTIVQPPNSPPDPMVNIQNSPIIGGCSDFVMSLSALTGSGGRPFISLSFSVTPPPGSLAFSSAVEIERLLNQEAEMILIGKRSQIIIPAQKLGSLNDGFGVYPGLYSISVVLKNFWGKTGTKSYAFQFSQDKLLPNVLLNGPGYISVDPRKDNSIFALVTMSSSSACGSVAKANYKFDWKLQGFLTNPITSRKSSLLLKPLSLQPGSSYNASLIVSVFLNNEVTSYSYSYVFNTSLDIFTSSLGSNRQIGDIQSFKLTPEVKNEFYRRANYSNYDFVWQCTKNGLPCKNKNDITLNILEFVNQSPSGQDFINIPSDTLSVGIYTFTVNATNKMTGSVGQAITTEIEIVAGRVPDVSITSTSKKPSSFDNKFEITAQVVRESVSSFKNLQFNWSSEAECDSVSYDVAPMDDASLVTKRSSSILKFKTEVLVPGASYCFSLYVEDRQTKANTTSYFVTNVRERPSSGSCVAANTVDNVVTIRSLLDDFTFNCGSWITDSESYPLLYSFEILKKGTQNWVSVSRNTPDSSLTMAMLEGEYTVRALISDQSGTRAANPVSLTVNVTKFSFGLRKREESDSFYNFVGEWLSNRSTIFQSTQNIQGFSSALSTIATMPFDLISSESHKNLQSISFNALKEMLDSGLVSFDEDSVSYLANQIQTFTGINCSIPSSNIDSSLELVDSLLDKANITTMELGESLTSSTLDKLLGTLNNLTCASGSELSDNLLSKKNSLLQKVSAIALRRAGCGEVAYVSNYTDIEVQVGKEVSSEYLESSDRSIGLFNLTVLDDVLTTCAPYLTGKKSSKGIEYPANENIDGSVYQMSYLSDSGTPQNISNGQIEVKFTIDLSNATLLNGNQPMCSYLKYADESEDISTAEVSQDGCEVLTINTVAGKVTCLCRHLSDFLIAYSPVINVIETTAPPTSSATNTPSPSPSSPSAGSSNNTSTIIAAAVGGSIGALLLIGAALFVGLKVLPKRSKYSPGVENDSKNEQVMIGIPGPSNQNGSSSSIAKDYPSDLKNADFS